MSATEAGRRVLGNRFTKVHIIALCTAVLCVQTVRTAGPGTQGQWTTLPDTMPINPVHVALMHNGKVLVVSGSGNVATNTVFESSVWDPQTRALVTPTSVWGWDMFCNAMVVLPDGRVLVTGGTLAYDPFKGQKRNATYDPATDQFTEVQPMAHGRWYPTATVLGDGRMMTFSGLLDTSGTNTSVEIYTPGTGWSPEYPAGWTPPLYPRLHLITDGRVFYSGSGTGSRFFNPSTHAWTGVVATTKYSGTRTYGTSVLLPLTPSNNYQPRVMIMGGGSPATATTEIIDLSAATPAWQFGPNMSQPRIEMNATILPNGKVLAMGGSTNDEDASTASKNADLYDPTTNTFSSAGANSYPRLYHSNSLLLPDATVLLVGGNPQRGSYEAHNEVYSPAYLFNADGTPAARPTISDVSPSTMAYGASFQVTTPNAASIGSVVLVRPGAATHAFDMDQRLVGLAFTSGAGVLNVTAPPNGNIAPPGYYMLFILNTAGTPSTATFVRLSGATANQAPTASITTPTSNVTVQAGQSQSFVGTGSDTDGSISSYAWTFPGGSPASSSSANAGSIVYNTPGSYTASLSVTDNGGLSSAPATRAVSVPDFSWSATPSSRAIWPGQSTTYSGTVTPGSGFAGSVGFGISGLPAGATATFSPTSVSTSGSTTMNVLTSNTTPPGSYPLMMTATRGPISHSVPLTLVINADFQLSVSPGTQTIAPGGDPKYTVTITGAGGFAGTVALAVSGLPKFAQGQFSPSSVTGSGNSTLTITTNKKVARQTYNLTITATSGGVSHFSNVGLVIN